MMRTRSVLASSLLTIGISALVWAAYTPAAGAADNAGDANAAGAGADRHVASTTPSGERPAPSFTLPIHAGGTVSLDSLRGKVVLVDFWASWCGPCKMSFPWLRTMHERYSSKGLEIVAIDLDKSRDAADAFLEEIPAPFVVADDPSGKTAEAFKVKAMPSSFLISPRGEIIYSHAGFDPKKTGVLEALIREAVAS